MDNSEPAQLNYAMAPERPFPMRWAITLISLWTVGIAMLMAPLVFVVPPFAAIFRDFGTTLPLPTTALLACSRFLIQYGLVLLLMAFALTAVVAAILGLGDQAERKIRHAVIASLAVFVGLLVLEVFLLLAGLFLPMTNLIQSVSKH